MSNSVSLSIWTALFGMVGWSTTPFVCHRCINTGLEFGEGRCRKCWMLTAAELRFAARPAFLGSVAWPVEVEAAVIESTMPFHDRATRLLSEYGP